MLVTETSVSRIPVIDLIIFQKKVTARTCSDLLLVLIKPTTDSKQGIAADFWKLHPKKSVGGVILSILYL